MEPVKLCVNCKHFAAIVGFCYHPSFGIDLVNGNKNGFPARFQRLETGDCKAEGINFEPKEE